MNPSFLEPKFLERDSCLTCFTHKVDATGSYQLQVGISVQDVGARDMPKSPYNSYSYSDVPPSSLPHIIRLRAGNVIFNSKYYNNTMQKTEGSRLLKHLGSCGFQIHWHVLASYTGIFLP
ncbi:hypothetical protein VPH35_051789 [Triticum aestivum]